MRSDHRQQHVRGVFQGSINGTSLDKLSIMLYEIPKSWTTNGFSSKANEKLSETDRKFAHNQCNYPFDRPRKQPRA
jgi:hypothetical protein